MSSQPDMFQSEHLVVASMHTQLQIWVAGPSSLHQTAVHAHALPSNDIFRDLSKRGSEVIAYL